MIRYVETMIRQIPQIKQRELACGIDNIKNRYIV